MEQLAHLVYWFCLAAQLIAVWQTYSCVESMHAAWGQHQEDMQDAKPHTVLSWPFHGAVRAFVLNRNCEKVLLKQKSIQEAALEDHATCVLTPDANNTWHYWPPDVARAMRVVTKDTEFSASERRLFDAQGFLKTTQETFQDAKHLAKRIGDDTGERLRTYTNKCTNQTLVFGKVGIVAKYFNLILLGEQAEDMASEVQSIDLTPEHVNWSQKRKAEYDQLFWCLVACLIVKFFVGKINSCLSCVSESMASSRSRCDKRWETLFMGVFSSMLFICLQTTLSTMFLLVWRSNCAIATNIPCCGLVLCVALFVFISVFNECDKCRDWSSHWCNAFNTALFWCLFGLMVLVITIPLFALTYYNLQFFYEVYMCHISKARVNISSAFKQSAAACSKFMVVFVVGAFLELFLLCMMDSYESERERRPATLPHEVRGKAYRLVSTQ